jgi:hypothetical protein
VKEFAAFLPADRHDVDLREENKCVTSAEEVLDDGMAVKP